MLVFVLSLPRSGSTVLTSILDRTKGIVCHPESSFPQVLGEIPVSIRQNPKELAAFYLASTYPGTPLGIREATDCMRGSDEQILRSLGLKLAEIQGRNPDDVKTVVWKTTRTIGMNSAPLATAGRFVVMRRNPINVYESQFRVDFGKHNRNPLRFALFRESYEAAFSKIPADRKMDINYDEMPDNLAGLLRYLGIEADVPWASGISSLESVAKTRPWLSEITQEFQNRDPEKRNRISFSQRLCVAISLGIARAARPLASITRRHFDRKSLETITVWAQRVLAEDPSEKQYE